MQRRIYQVVLLIFNQMYTTERQVTKYRVETTVNWHTVVFHI